MIMQISKEKNQLIIVNIFMKMGDYFNALNVKMDIELMLMLLMKLVVGVGRNQIVRLAMLDQH